MEDEISPPGKGQVLVQAILSAISPGTEMLVYRGQFPNIAVDSVFSGLADNFAYPMKYGYSNVGRVIEIGEGVDRQWLDRLVFSFQPHTSHYLAELPSLLFIPEGILPESACFFPNAETAVNLVQDAAPLIGERVMVLGQGIIGLLTSALLMRFPLESLVCVDFFPMRREAASGLGIKDVLDPSHLDFELKAKRILKSGADISLELTGSPLALNSAIALTAYSGRIVIGSWYGEKRAPIDLGGSFHRSRIKLISSQVSTISPELSGRWDKCRRYETVWDALRLIEPQKWITHRFFIDKAADAYQLLDNDPQDAIQIVLEY